MQDIVLSGSRIVPAETTGQCRTRAAFCKGLVAACALISVSASADTLEEFGEGAGRYFGTCHALSYLSSNQCPRQGIENLGWCIQNAKRLLPSRLKDGFTKDIAAIETQLKTVGEKAAQEGFEKISRENRLTRSEACRVYLGMMLAVREQQFETLKILGKLIK